jgi:purine-binding chemotaxis protein CheW
MPDVDSAPAPGQAAARRFLTFRMGDGLYALPAEEVSEVIRVPAVARLPQGPKSLLGLANLRGSVLPVASLRGLLGREEQEARSSSRAILLDGAAPVALAVDAVQGLVTVQSDRVERGKAELAADPGERLTGAFESGAEGRIAKILDIRGLLTAAFAPRARTDRGARAPAAGDTGRGTVEEEERQALLTFEVAGQEYALALACVQEIVPAPATLALVPRAEALVLGVTSHRQSLMPMLSLRGLLGFPASPETSGREKVIVTTVGGALVGLVADRVRAILHADPSLVEPTPSVLAARTGGEARIAAIYRGEDGRRLVSILAPEQLFREDVMQRLGAGREAAGPEADGEPQQRDERQFLVFRLGEEEFALPIEAVDEVARVPEQITRVPRTPKFLEGVVNLRGEVLPVVDQRRRFEMPSGVAGPRRRLVVVRTERHRAGLIVDSVSEVLRTAADAIEPAPDLTDEPTRLVEGIINLGEAGRMVLLLDPSELLSRTERGLLDAFEAETAQAPL